MISTITYNGDGTTRIFPVAFEILGEEYIVVFIGGIAVADKTKYDIINNSIVFNAEDAPPLGTNNVEIVVASSPTEIANLNAPPSTIQTVVDNITNINILSERHNSIDTIVNNLTSLNTAATNISSINTATTNIVAINTAATNIADINMASTNIADINTAATNIADIKNASIFAATAVAKASEASASATAAHNAQLAAEAVFDNFDDKYLGAKATAPTVDNDGNPLVTGALYFRTTAPKGIYVYDAELSAWSIFSYIPTSHGTLSGRSDADSHPMDAITGLIEALLAKAPLSSPALTGTPTAPTQVSTDNSTKIATTAFVKALLVSASQTVSGLIEIATNAEVQAGTDTIKAVTPAGLLSAFANSKNSNGYTKLPNGLILEWGTVATGWAAATVFNFPLTFPTACFGCYPVVDTSANQGITGVRNITTSGFQLDSISTSALDNPIKWFAIGY